MVDLDHLVAAQPRLPAAYNATQQCAPVPVHQFQRQGLPCVVME